MNNRLFQDWPTERSCDFFKTKTEFENFLKENCKDLNGIIKIAQLSQQYNLSTQSIEALQALNPYAFLSLKSHQGSPTFSKKTDELYWQDYLDLLVYYIGFFSLHVLIRLGDLTDIADACDTYENCSIHNAMLNLISNVISNENNININRLLKRNLEVILKKKKNRASMEFEDLLTSLVKLPASVLIKHYNIYGDFLRKNAYFLDVCQEISLLKLKKIDVDNHHYDDYVEPLQIELSQTTLPNSKQMIELVIDIVAKNGITMVADYSQKEIIMIDNQMLNKFGFSFLCEVRTDSEMFANVIGIVKNDLLLHVNHPIKNDLSLRIPITECNKIKKINETNYKSIIQTKLFKTILHSLESQLSRIMVKFNLGNLFDTFNNNFMKTTTLMLTNTENVFLELHASLVKNLQPIKNLNLQHNLSLFISTRNLIAKNFRPETNVKQLILKILPDITTNLSNVDLNSLSYFINSFSENEIKNQYRKYIHLLNQANKILNFSRKKDPTSIESLEKLAIITSYGSIIEIDMSTKTLNKFGAKFFQHLLTKKGSEIILGVCNDELVTHRLPDNVLHSSNVFLDTLNKVVTPDESSAYYSIHEHLNALIPSLLKNNLSALQNKITSFIKLSTSSTSYWGSFFENNTEYKDDSYNNSNNYCPPPKDDQSNGNNNNLNKR